MIVTGTGHRPNKLGGYSDQVYQRLVVFARRQLVGLLSLEEEHTIISGMALGWDQALLQAAAEISKHNSCSDDPPLKLIAAIPFAGQEARWPTEAQRKYHHLLSLCNEIVIVCEGSYANWKMQKRNEYLCSHADIILALWNGTSGGTANCVSYAQRVGKKVINCWSEWEKSSPQTSGL